MSVELNKIYLGDAYELIKQIPDKSIDCVYVDIPYLYDSGGSGSSQLSQRIKKQHKVVLNDIRNGIDYSIFEQYKRVMKKINLFIWCSKNQILDIMNYWINNDVFFEILTWNKTNPTPQTNNTWLPDIEYCLYFRESGVKLNDGYEIKSKWYSSPINKKDKDYFKHPTIKPLEFVKNHILHVTQANDIVLDTFLGSGTTAVACVETKRSFIGFEKDLTYFDIAQNRVNGVPYVEIKEKENGIMNIFDFMGSDNNE